MVDTFKSFLDKFLTPLTFTSILGLVIWGVQLNFQVLEMTRIVSTQQRELASVIQEHRDYEVSIARTAIIQNEMLKQLDYLGNKLDAHEKEAEGWKRKIIRNQEILNGLKR
jgi:hypothetical protein